MKLELIKELINVIIIIACITIYHFVFNKPTTPTTGRTTTPEIESIQTQKGDLNQSIKTHYDDTINQPKGNRNDTLINNMNRKWND